MVGKLHLRQCPSKGLSEGVVRLCQYADLAKAGSWPEGGGLNDQPATFVHAVRELWRAESVCQAERNSDGRARR
jgi:hypothetical protein